MFDVCTVQIPLKERRELLAIVLSVLVSYGTTTGLITPYIYQGLQAKI
jgi:hypothetical protein